MGRQKLADEALVSTGHAVSAFVHIEHAGRPEYFSLQIILSSAQVPDALDQHLHGMLAIAGQMGIFLALARKQEMIHPAHPVHRVMEAGRDAGAEYRLHHHRVTAGV